MKRLMFLVAVAMVISPAQAYWMKGSDLVEMCQKIEPDDFPCTTYVVGVADMVIAVPISKSGFAAVCFGDLTMQSGGYLKRIVVEYLISHPEETHKPAVLLVTSALKETFRCE